MYYTGRDMKLSHEGMKISDSDWEVFIGHAVDTMAELKIPEVEQGEIASFVTSLKPDIVEL
jgi:hemoglobin